jgi:hypothetical protein
MSSRARNEARSTVKLPSFLLSMTSPIQIVEPAKESRTAACSGAVPRVATNLLFSISAATFLPIRRKTRIRELPGADRSSPTEAEPTPVSS